MSIFKKFSEYNLSPKFCQVLGNTGWLFSEKILQMGLGLVVGVWVARYLGPEQFGLLNYAIAFVSLFNPLTTLGFDGITVRELVQNVSKKEEILGTTLVLRIISGCFNLLLIISIIYFLRPDEALTRWLVAILAVGKIFQSFDTIDFWFRSQIQSKYTVLSKNIGYIFITLIRIILIQSKAPLIAFACLKSTELVMNAGALLLVYYLQGESIKTWRFRLSWAEKLLRDSWPIMLAGISTYIYSAIDQVMLGQMATVKSLGIYAVAVKLSEVFNFLPTVIAQSMLPVVVQKHQQGEEILLDTMQGVYDIMSILWFSVALPVSLLSPWIILKIYGEAYSDSAIVLTIYIWSQFGSNFGIARGLYINVKNIFKASLIISFSGAIINILLNSWMIPRYEELGATIATLITYFIAVIAINVFFKELRKLLPLIARSLVFPSAIYRIMKRIKKRATSND